MEKLNCFIYIRQMAEETAPNKILKFDLEPEAQGYRIN